MHPQEPQPRGRTTMIQATQARVFARCAGSGGVLTQSGVNGRNHAPACHEARQCESQQFTKPARTAIQYAAANSRRTMLCAQERERACVQRSFIRVLRATLWRGATGGTPYEMVTQDWRERPRMHRKMRHAQNACRAKTKCASKHCCGAQPVRGAERNGGYAMKTPSGAICRGTFYADGA